MVSPDARRFVALMDWGSAACGSQVDDFAATPLRVVPFVLDGYRDSTQTEEDPRIEVRIVWRHVQLGLITLPRGPLPGFSWAERPLSMLQANLQQTEAFNAGYERARARPWSREEREVCWTAGLWHNSHSMSATWATMQGTRGAAAISTG